MTAQHPIFHGTQKEAYELSVAIEHNCHCDIDPDTGVRTTTCPAHKMILDQRILNGLDCEHRRAAELLEQEFAECTPTDLTRPAYRMHVPPGPDGANCAA